MRYAFPLAIPPNCGDYDLGQSLREYFVGCALQGATAGWFNAPRQTRNEYAQTTADMAVRIADAVIERLGAK